MSTFIIFITVHIAIMGYGVFKGGSSKNIAIASLCSIALLFLFGGSVTGEQMLATTWVRFIYNMLVLSTLMTSIGWYLVEIIFTVKEKIALYKNCDAGKGRD